MSAPTPDLLTALEPYEGRLIRATRDTTPADVRLWLLDQGATERTWCEVHDALPDREDWTGVNCDWADSTPCRMVSVLVWRTPDSEQVSPTNH